MKTALRYLGYTIRERYRQTDLDQVAGMVATWLIVGCAVLVTLFAMSVWLSSFVGRP